MKVLMAYAFGLGLLPFKKITTSKLNGGVRSYENTDEQGEDEALMDTPPKKKITISTNKVVTTMFMVQHKWS